MEEEQIIDNADAESNNGANPEKKFTQSELEKIVKDRIARQKKEHDTALESVNSELTSQKELNASYEAQLNTLIDAQLGDVPESMKELLSKLSITDKLEWIQKHKDEMNTFQKQVIPTTPKTGDAGDKPFKPNTKNLFKI